jgi:exopolysaccharide production protein ExoQ
VWEEKNALGGHMALFFPAFAAAAIFNPKRRVLWCGMAVLCVALLLASTSKTALLAMMLGMGGMVMVALIRSGAAMAVITTWLAVVFVGVVAGVLIFDHSAVLALLGKDATLTMARSGPMKAAGGRWPGSSRTPISAPTIRTIAGWNSGCGWA